MSGWLDKIRRKISPSHGDKAADSIEKNVTDERVDSVLDRTPGGEHVAGRVPDDVGTQAGDTVRSNFGSKKENP